MLCRVCLIETPSYIDIFDEIGQKLQIAEIVQKHLWFKPQPADALTTQICTICWNKIDEFHQFYETVEKAHKVYGESIKIEIQCPTSSIKMEHDTESLINNSDYSVLEPKCELQTKNPLEENFSEILLDEESEDEDSRSSDAYEPSHSSQKELTTDEETPNKNFQVIEKRSLARKKRLASNKQQQTLEKVKDGLKKKRVIQGLDSERTEEMIRKHIPMHCNLCLFVGTTFSDIVQHFKDVHPKVKPYIMCCNKKLSKGFFVAQHAMKHDDPSRFSCKECNKSFSGFKGLRAHNSNYHARNEDLIYACDSCPKKFARNNLLELHKISHLTKDQYQYICNKCPEKKFASNYLLSIHKSMCHNRALNVCPVCARVIKDKRSFEKHVRLHYEDSGPRIKCPYPGCDSWLKDEENLKKHFVRHSSEQKIHKCDECGKECISRLAVTNHKRYAHTNQVFQCDQCDKTFKKSISLREHRAQHTGEILYKCPFCTRTFNSNANMHAHKKKLHPVEWEEWRRNKRGSAQKLINSSNAFQSVNDTFANVNDSLSFLK